MALAKSGDSVGASVTTVTVDAAVDGALSIPGISFENAEFSRTGPDLVIEDSGGGGVVVRGFFDVEPLPRLAFDGGETMVPGDLAARLAGPLAPAQVAQTDFAPNDEPIGTVEIVDGLVTATRADGTVAALEVGDPVFLGDIMETGAGSGLGIVLADQTTFAMAENGRMVLDEMIYDPGGQDGSLAVSVLEGVFTFVSGQIAKTDADSMTIDTPLATIGVRGTQGGLALQNGQLTAVVMEESEATNNFVGEMAVSNGGGAAVLNVLHYGTVVAGASVPPTAAAPMSVEQLLSLFGASFAYLPDINGGANSYGVERADAGDLDDFDTAAGGPAAPFSDGFGFVDVTGDGGLTSVSNVIVPPPDLFGGAGTGDPDDDDEPDSESGDSDDPLLLVGDAGDDTLTFAGGGTIGDDVLFGGKGDDVIDGGPGNDTISGNGGNDTITGGDGNDTLNGGTGTDTAVFSGPRANYTLAMDGGDGQVTDNVGAGGTDNLDSFEFLQFADQTIDLSSGAITGGAGDDVIGGTVNDDVINGGGGNDTLTGGDGNDQLFGGPGSDTLSGGPGDDLIDGGAGFDTASFNDDAAGITVDVAAGTVTGNSSGDDDLVDIEALIGGSGNDIVNMTPAGPITDFDLGGGTDRLNLLGTGTYTLGLTGVEEVDGGGGTNLTQIVNLSKAVGVGVIDLGDLTDTINLTTAGATYEFGLGSVEVLNGAGGNETVRLSGSNALNTLNLGGGNDTLVLTDPGTYQLGNTSVETITDEGGGGNVTIGFGNTNTIGQLSLGGGDDTVTVTGTSTIADMNLGGGTDRLNLQGTGTYTLGLTGVEEVDGGGGTNLNQIVNLSKAVGVGVIDLGDLTDTINLTTAGATYEFGLGSVEVLNGAGGNETVRLSASNALNTLNLGGGNDTLVLTNPGTYQLGNTSVETITDEGGGGNVTIGFGNTNTIGQLSLGGGDDTVTVTGTSTIADMDLGGGTDRLNLQGTGTYTLGLTGVEEVDGGGGTNLTQIVNLNKAEDVGLIDLGDLTDTINLTTAGATYEFGLSSVENLNGAGGDEIVRLSASNALSTLNLMGGNDTLVLTDPGDYQLGNTSVETVTDEGGSGDITIDFGATNTIGQLSLGGGDDTITVTGTSTIADMDLGGGTDRLNLQGTGTYTLGLTGVEEVDGGGGTNLNQIVNLSKAVGVGIIDLGDLTDTINLTTAGATYTFGVASVEAINGAGGNETLNLVQSATGVNIDLGGGNDTLNLADGGNNIDIAGIEIVNGGAGADDVTASGGTAVQMNGGAGADILTGGTGADTITGGSGDDTLTGGGGNDVFAFSLDDDGDSDLISDLLAGDSLRFDNVDSTEDVSIDAGAGANGGDLLTVSLIGGGSFTVEVENQDGASYSISENEPDVIIVALDT